MTKEEAINMLERLRFPDPWEPKLSKGAEEALDMALSVLSSDGEYIKKEDALGCFTWQNTKEDAWFAIKDLPVFSFPDSAKNKGEWMSTEDRPFGFCSKCDKDIDEAATPYCPYCGAKMTWVGAVPVPYKKGE